MGICSKCGSTFLIIPSIYIAYLSHAKKDEEHRITLTIKHIDLYITEQQYHGIIHMASFFTRCKVIIPNNFENN